MKLKDDRYINENINAPESVKSKTNQVSYVQYDSNLGSDLTARTSIAEENQRPQLNKR